MNDPSRTTPPTTGRGRQKVAVIGAGLLIAGAVYVSRATLPPAPVAAADEPKGKKPAPPTPRAVDAANAFLDALDPEQREKAVPESGSEKKSNWSNVRGAGRAGRQKARAWATRLSITTFFGSYPAPTVPRTAWVSGRHT